MNHSQPLIRRRGIICIITAFFLLVACAGSLCTQIHAENAGNRVDDVVSYESVLVCQGSSLWSIAKEQLENPTNAEIQSYVQEIISLNNLVSTDIHAGNYIIVPKYETL